MRSVCEVQLSRTLTILMLTALLVASSATGVRASLITNGDFATGDFTGWNATGNVDVVSYSTLPQAYASNWDLSSWNSMMNGNFALVQFDPTNTHNHHLTAVITTGPSRKVKKLKNNEVTRLQGIKRRHCFVNRGPLCLIQRPSLRTRRYIFQPGRARYYGFRRRWLFF